MGKTQGKTITDKQAAFAREYIIDNNGTQAAIRAGYSPNGAKVRASVLLTNDNIIAEINRLQDKIAEKAEWTVQRSQQLLLETRARAIELKQPAVEVSSVVAINRLYGLDKDVVTDTAKIELDAAQAIEAKRLAQIRLYAG